ncbi:hypothetical protein QKC54_gp0033 [Megavirus baoshan]|uniref:Uncharacterized protein n=1 Tax=Megavirus baoshan TaxID=2496520 RepID=A0A8K1W7J5_9VIRU|nr:hypothetical protein QKC54_gp0033 [Megavirus baoshan]UFX99925.1 hypothetical protein Mb1039 [Megavirus baoshan]
MPKKYHKKKIYFSDSEDSFSDKDHNNNNSDNDSINEYSDDDLNTEDLNKKISKKIDLYFFYLFNLSFR